MSNKAKRISSRRLSLDRCVDSGRHARRELRGWARGAGGPALAVHSAAAQREVRTHQGEAQQVSARHAPAGRLPLRARARLARRLPRTRTSVPFPFSFHPSFSLLRVLVS